MGRGVGKRLGLTGGIACGKGEVGKFLARRGWCRIDCDQLVGDLLATDKGLQAILVDRWGREVEDSTGKLDKARLAGVVFAREADLAWLEQQLHPRVRRAWQQQAAQAGEVPVVVEVPLLFEVGWEADFDQTLAVVASDEVQKKRLATRPGGLEAGKKRLARQWTMDQKMEKADIVLANNGTRAFLELQIEYWLRTFLG